MDFSQQGYWSGLPFLPPGDLPTPGIESTSSISPAGGFFTTAPPGKPMGDDRRVKQGGEWRGPGGERRRGRGQEGSQGPRRASSNTAIREHF